jgi:Tol biopolymer transport system component
MGVDGDVFGPRGGGCFTERASRRRATREGPYGLSGTGPLGRYLSDPPDGSTDDPGAPRRFRPPSAQHSMPHIRLAAALLAALSLAACDGLFEPGERAQDQILFKRYVDASRKNSPFDSLDIYRMNADGTGQRNLTGHLAQYGLVSPSPDGRRVVFQSDRGSSGVAHVWVMNTDGSGLKQLVAEYSTYPRWSPDGTRIAFQKLDAEGLHVFVMNADGTHPVKVSGPAMQVGSVCPVTNPGTRIGLVDWTPDGRVAFTRHYCGFGYRYFLVNADGSGFTETQIKLYDAFWSPDGSKVVYPWPEGGNWRVMLANGDGSGAHVLTTQGTHQGLPWTGYSPWSPDGKQIMFFADNAEVGSSPKECDGAVLPYVVNVDGSGVKKLMDWCRGPFNGWSPSGDQVAFTIFPPGSIPASVPDVHVVQADGSGTVNATNSPFWESEPVWIRGR